MCKIQANIPICPSCSGALRKILTDVDIVYVCRECKISLKVTDCGQSERELICEVTNG